MPSSPHAPLDESAVQPAAAPPVNTRKTEIAIRNRRLIYLQNNEEYFTRTDHAFSLPTLYDQLVSRFMTGRDRRDHAADPAAQAKFSEILARDLERGEDRLEQLRKQRGDSTADDSEDEMDIEEIEDENGNIIRPSRRALASTSLHSMSSVANHTTDEHPPETETEDPDAPPDAEPLDADILLQADANGEFTTINSREEAWEIWREILSRRFLRGDDEDFDYDSVDRPGGAGDPHHLIEVEIERDGWEEYFDGEEADVYVERDGKMYLGERVLEGETGIQDF
ncbi:hypothetical protein Dda_4918 [Drechslerella dactyloides]|uniref:CCD97-like C-terminal domain-containing protein n=1 Tax=Drechslerella dactyloides TaxID=74499 RepID=A0AAD6IZ92_DREDA|nr:hypothetical protein Dda_4918 [Drechslerella dactyloides]